MAGGTAKVTPGPGPDDLWKTTHQWKHVNTCHNFEWSRTLWSHAASRISYVCIVLVSVYITLAATLASIDGVRGVDLPYFISATATTVGFGDVSASSQGTRAASIFLLPLGISLIGFGISLVMARANSTESSSTKMEEARAADALLQSSQSFQGQSVVEEKNNKKPNIGDLKMIQSFLINPDQLAPAAMQERLQRFSGSLAGSLFRLLLKYLGVLSIGVLFFTVHDDERKLHQENGEDLTLIDSLFLSTVIASTVGYGHKYWGRHDSTKIFLTFYFVFSTVVVGQLLSDMSAIYLQHKGNAITLAMLDAVTWVHTADLTNRQCITQADYVLFKLRQLQKLDESMLKRLTTQFTELDLEQKCVLTIGVHVPSAVQVEDIDAAIKNTPKTRHEGWMEMRRELVMKHMRDHGIEAESKDDDAVVEEEADDDDDDSAKASKRLLAVGDFTESRKLWAQAATNTAVTTVVLTAAWTALGLLIVSIEGWDVTTGLYYLSATLSTVGLGDFAPVTQAGRGGAVIVIPYGLVIIGLLLSLKSTFRLAKPALHEMDDVQDAHKRALFNALDLDKKNKLDLQEVTAAASQLGLSQVKAAELFNSIDVDNRGVLERPVPPPVPFRESLPGRICILVAKLYLVVLVGALSLKLFFENMDELSWVDAIYFSTVVSTSVGYGDIVPTNEGGRVFMIFYFLASTVIVAGALHDFVDIYVLEYEGEKITEKIINSTTWVHRADINSSGDLTEADFVLFKLQQLQMVDTDMVEDLVIRFIQLDVMKDNRLNIGVDVPSASQVKELYESVNNDTKELPEAWRKMQLQLFENRQSVILEEGLTSNDSSSSRRASEQVELAEEGAATESSPESISNVSTSNVSTSSQARRSPLVEGELLSSPTALTPSGSGGSVSNGVFSGPSRQTKLSAGVKLPPLELSAEAHIR